MTATPATRAEIRARHLAGPRAPLGSTNAFHFGWEACSVTIARDGTAAAPPRACSAEWKRGWEARKAQATCAS
jgi:hypothetical protein